MIKALLKSEKIKFKILCVLALAFVITLHGAIPMVMSPSSGQGLWIVGFAKSISNNSSLFDFYAYNFGIPAPAAIPLGLSGALPTSYLIRSGFNPIDAYTIVYMLLITLSFWGAYKFATTIINEKWISIVASVTWLSIPITWAHTGYSMVVIGITLMPLFLFSTFNIIELRKKNSNITYLFVYSITTVLSVFTDGYTFVMFASGASLIILLKFLSCGDSFSRKQILQRTIPIHLAGFLSAYFLYVKYVGHSFEPHSLDYFRSWGLDITFTLIPSQGMHWLPDILGLSTERSSKQFWGDASVWQTTFSLPIILGALWGITKTSKNKIFLIIPVAIFGIYMSLGPNLKINHMKVADQQSEQLMKADETLLITGSHFISENIPGFRSMRASYRWLTLFLVCGWWLMLHINLNMQQNSRNLLLPAILLVTIIIYLPNPYHKWKEYTYNREIFTNIDKELVENLEPIIASHDHVLFLPWGNDFMVNYIAAKLETYTFNIGGDKNLAFARKKWPKSISYSLNKNNFNDTSYEWAILTFAFGDVDKIIIPKFDLFHNSFIWPPSKDDYEQRQSMVNNFEQSFDVNECFTLNKQSYFSVIQKVPSIHCSEFIYKRAQKSTNLNISNWGPKSTKKSIVPNIQPDGGGGLWITLNDEVMPFDVTVYFDGVPAKISHNGRKIITASISPDLFLLPGKKLISLENSLTKKTIMIGEFEVYE